MKKQLIVLTTLLVSALLVLSFSSCGKKSGGNGADDDLPLVREDSTGKATSRTNETENLPDFASIMAGNGSTDTVWGLQEAAARQEIIDSARLDGYDVSFGDDGSMTVKDKDGLVITQDQNGTWTFRNSDGSIGQIGGDWQVNEFTNSIPEPDFKILNAYTSETGFTASFQSVTLDQIRSYAGKVKARGFTVDPEEEEMSLYETVIYSYSAKNADGYSVSISFANGTGGIAVNK